MGKLIDICGEPVDLDTIKEFHIFNRDYIYYPSYTEMLGQKRSIFARSIDRPKKFEFCKMVPFGCVLGEKEKPTLGGYEIKSFGEVAGKFALESVTNMVANAGNIAADLLRIDTSGNKTYTILTVGKRTTTMQLRDIPAKVMFLSGKVADVYKNDPLYEFLGEPIAPVIMPVKTLVLNTGKQTLVFFGSGIDLDNPYDIYNLLIERHNASEDMQKEKHQKGIASFPHLAFPKFISGTSLIKKQIVSDENAKELTNYSDNK